MKNSPSFSEDEFVEMLTSSQSALRGYIMASLADQVNCQDVLQKTNMALWSKRKDYQPGRPFLTWALAFARYEILAFVRDDGRDTMVFHSDVVEMMAELNPPAESVLAERQRALSECLGQLSEFYAQVCRMRYVQNQSLDDIARVLGRSAKATKSMLARIRTSLRKCVEKRRIKNELELYKPGSF